MRPLPGRRRSKTQRVCGDAAATQCQLQPVHSLHQGVALGGDLGEFLGQALNSFTELGGGGVRPPALLQPGHRLGIDLRPLCTHGTNGLAADPACLQVAPDGTFGNAKDLCGLGNGERNICCGIHATVFVTGRPTPCLTSGDTPVRA